MSICPHALTIRASARVPADNVCDADSVLGCDGFAALPTDDKVEPFTAGHHARLHRLRGISGRRGPGRRTAARGADAEVIVGPHPPASRTADPGVPLNNLLLGDSVPVGHGPAVVTLHHAVEAVAVVHHAVLDRLRRCVGWRRGGRRSGGRRRLATHNADAGVVAGPEVVAGGTADLWVPRVHLGLGQAVLVCQSPAVVICADEMEMVAIVDHAGLGRLRGLNAISGLGGGWWCGRRGACLLRRAGDWRWGCWRRCRASFETVGSVCLPILARLDGWVLTYGARLV